MHGIISASGGLKQPGGRVGEVTTKFAGLASLLFLFSAHHALADAQKGFKAMKSGDYKTAFMEWHKSAIEGDMNAQYNLALMYDTGRGVARDLREAANWYREAADKGHIAAQYNLGCMYDEGSGVPRDLAAAFGWYRKAAEMGHPKAQYNLGTMYIKGEGTPRNVFMGLVWLDISAAGANGDAVEMKAAVEKRVGAARAARAKEEADAWIHRNAGAAAPR